MRASRLLTILIKLQQEGRVTAGSLAEQLEVSKRTIYRDIDELSAAGVPVYADRGPSGGFALLDGFRTELTGLTAAETEALLFAGVPAAAADLGLAVPAAAARLKVLAGLPAQAREEAERVAARFHLDLADWYKRPSAPAHLHTVARAVWTGRRLRLRYQSWNRTSDPAVDPLGLVLKAGQWYLLARTSGSDRTYRLASMIEAELLDENFDRPQGYDLANAWSQNVARFEAGLRNLKAILRASASSLDRLDRLGADIAAPLLAADPDERGRRTAEVAIEGVPHAAGLLLGFGDEIEVLEPVELRKELSRRAQLVLDMYGGT